MLWSLPRPLAIQAALGKWCRINTVFSTAGLGPSTGLTTGQSYGGNSSFPGDVGTTPLPPCNLTHFLTSCTLVLALTPTLGKFTSRNFHKKILPGLEQIAFSLRRSRNVAVPRVPFRSGVVADREGLGLISLLMMWLLAVSPAILMAVFCSGLLWVTVVLWDRVTIEV